MSSLTNNQGTISLGTCNILKLSTLEVSQKIQLMFAARVLSLVLRMRADVIPLWDSLRKARWTPSTLFALGILICPMTPNLKFVDGTPKRVAIVGVAAPRTKKRADVRSVVLCNIGISRRRVEGAERKRPGHNLDLRFYLDVGCAFTRNKGP